MNYALQMRQTDVTVGDNSFNLMELCEMCRVQVLVPEHAVDREQFSRAELLLLRDCVQHSRRNRSRVSSEDIFLSFFLRPVISPAIF